MRRLREVFSLCIECAAKGLTSIAVYFTFLSILRNYTESENISVPRHHQYVVEGYYMLGIEGQEDEIRAQTIESRGHYCVMN